MCFPYILLLQAHCSTSVTCKSAFSMECLQGEWPAQKALKLEQLCSVLILEMFNLKMAQFHMQGIARG